MRKLKDEEAKELRGIAGNLPPDVYIVADSVTMTGEEMRLSGYDEMPEYKGTFEDGKTYEVPIPAYCQMNHYRRLKKAFLSAGVEGVTKYIQPYLDKRKLELHNERIKAN